MSTALPSTHPLQPCWDLAAAAIQAQGLDTALELGLFDALDQPLTAAALAERLGLHAGNTGHLLELLWSLDLVLRRQRSAGGDLYEAAPVARSYLQRHAPRFCGEAWRYRLQSLRQMATGLPDQVRLGPQPPQARYQSATGAGWAAAARAQIGQEQRAVTADAALALLAHLPEVHQARRLLDLGGGPGWIAIALARQHPQLQGTVFDWPETVAVAQENIVAAGLDSRLHTRGGDLNDADWGDGDYDLLWCSSVLHFVDDVPATLQRMHDALRPGGLLVCAHAELADTPEAARRVQPYYLPMRLLGRYVPRAGAIAAALQTTGFVEVESWTCPGFPMAPVQVVAARRAPAGAAPAA